MNSAPKNILHVEDDPSDALMLTRAFKKNYPEFAVRWVETGEEAIQVLQAIQHRPDIILLDLKLPGINGFDVLQWVKGQAACSRIPVVVLSSSPLPEDKHRASALGAADYIEKSPEWSCVAHKVATLANC